MFKHNILLAVRNFKRYKSSFFINLTGLSTGLACALLIYLWVNDELLVDKFHKKDAFLFQVMEHQQYAEEIMTTTSTPGILAEALKDEIPEITYAATTTWISDYTLSVGNINVKAEGYHVGEDFFNIFSYRLVQGNPDLVLSDKNAIVISENLAERLFNTTENVTGKAIEFQHEKEFIISGVFKDTPPNSSYRFDFVLSFEEYKENNDWVLEWGNNGPKTYVVLQELANPDRVSEKIAGFVNDKSENSNITLFLKPYSDQYLYGRYRNGQQTGGRIEYVTLFSVIAVFILLIACINFMNLSTARASRRTKEVGVKKAIGAYRHTLIYQYLGESMIMAVLSLIVALVIVQLFLPQFNQITDKQIHLTFTPSLLGWIAGIGIVTGFIAGSYPALYISGFRPSVVLKGNVKGSLGELWARKGLVIFQFTLSIILIVAVMVVYQQVAYVQTKNLGYNKDNVVFFEIEGQIEKKLETFLNELRDIPGIVSASSIGHNLAGRQNNTSGLHWEGKNPDDLILFENVQVNYDLLETLGVELKEGRSFSREFGTDTAKIIFNETGIRVMGLENPIGKVIRLWSRHDLEIIGVVKDFHFQSLHEKVNPLFFILNPENTWNIMARIEAGNERATLDRLAKFYQSFNLGFEFDYTFLDEQYARLYAAEQRVAVLSRYFAGFAVLISCLGLFGLASFTAERRIKEIGIRKVMGSGVRRIVYLLSIDFTRLVLISILIAIPVSYFIVRNWLDRFAYRIELSAWFFIGAGVLALLIAWLTVGFQAIKAARVNPVECLRDE